MDFESSALTNAFPVHRLELQVGEEADAPAAYVRALDLSVERLDQRYVRLDDDGSRQRYQCMAPGFGYSVSSASSYMTSLDWSLSIRASRFSPAKAKDRGWRSCCA